VGRSGSSTRSPPASDAGSGEVSIPDKSFFRIGEVARLLGVKPFVLRYWETEFRSIRPQKSRSQQRLYRRRDVEQLLRIKRLLYDERYTIKGARQRLRELDEEDGVVTPKHREGSSGLTREVVDRIRAELNEILKLVEE
jgi:DNA-binding transcriptional MerR regulator